jgi:hypothetical protein
MLLGQQVRTTCVHLRTPPAQHHVPRSRRTLAMRLTRFGRPWSSSITSLNRWRLPPLLSASRTPRSASRVGMAATAATLIRTAARNRRALLGGRTKAQSPDGSSPTAHDRCTWSQDAAKSSPLGQSVIDLRNEFDEIAEEGESLPPHVTEPEVMTADVRLRLVRFILFHPIQI